MHAVEERGYMVAPALISKEAIGYVIKAERQQTIAPPTCKPMTFRRSGNSEKT
jgi:hypothetical protein